MKSAPITDFRDVSRRNRQVTYVVDPRFPGGTSSAVAHELKAISQYVRPRIVCLSSKMFSGQNLARPLQAAIAELGLELVWDPETIASDVVILHNPSFLKFQDELGCKIVARSLFVVTHENFLRPGGVESFDVARCLGAIDRASLALNKVLSPVSQWNRQTVTDWLRNAPDKGRWTLLADDWFNVCDFDVQEPTTRPRDRRGRLSRPGFEKFPSLEDMETCFPPHAERNLLLGADNLLDVAKDHPHWDVVPFRTMPVDAFFSQIDFMVYFISSRCRESFGRVLAEGIAAGKVVISDTDMAANFGAGVIGATPAEVDGIIRGFVNSLDAYRKQVRVGQGGLQRYSAARFAELFLRHVLMNGEIAT